MKFARRLTAVQAGVCSVQSIVGYGVPQSPAGAADHLGDDEFRFDVESLTAPVNDLSGVSAQLEAARQRWSENAPGDYELRVD